MTYGEMLKHPKWQKKRLEILERDQFECRDCGATDKTLHVHHHYYKKGLKLWDYPDDALETLCEDCHKDIHELTQRIQQTFSKIGSSGIHKVLGYALGLQSFDYPELPISNISTYETVIGMANFWQIPVKEVDSVLQNFTVYGRDLLSFK